MMWSNKLIGFLTLNIFTLLFAFGCIGACNNTQTEDQPTQVSQISGSFTNDGAEGPAIDEIPGLLVPEFSSDIILCVNNTTEIKGRLKEKIANAAVNVGHQRAYSILQQAINTVNPKAALPVDGQIGAKTKAALCGLSESRLIEAYAKRQADFYRSIVARNPSQQIFLNGWLRRAAWLPE